MVFYVRNADNKNLIEIETYWEEGNNKGAWFWTIDCHSYFYMRNFLPEFKDRSEFMTDKTLSEFIDDIDKIQQFRGYIQETLNVNSKIDRYNINAKESHDWMCIVGKEAESLLKSFCDKYGFYFNID
jgi:hypothetical protein